ncbi:HAD family hydrolase [Desulfovibrionales bacterium]
MPVEAHVLRAIQGVIFDCDGVLFNTRDLNRYYYNHILTELGLAPMTEEQEQYSFMHTVDAALAALIPSAMLDRAREVQGAMVYADFLGRMRPEPGIYELLDMLTQCGLRLAVNTNRKTSMEMVLERFAMEGIFDPVITAAKVALPKPDPQGVQMILAAWNLAQDQVVFIGDSDVDQQTTTRAGVPFWAYQNPDLTAQLHVDSFDDLRQWFVVAHTG